MRILKGYAMGPSARPLGVKSCGVCASSMPLVGDSTQSLEGECTRGRALELKVYSPVVVVIGVLFMAPVKFAGA